MQLMHKGQIIRQLAFSITAVLLVLTLSVLLLIIGYDNNEYRWILAGTLLFWCYGAAFGLVNLSKLYGYAIMHFMLFVFFLSRPTIANIYDTNWTIWDKGIVEKALLLVFISEVALFFGCYFMKQVPKAEMLAVDHLKNYIQVVQTVLLLAVLFTAVLCAYSVILEYSYYSDLAYEELYVPGGIQSGILVRASTTLFPYAVFAYLATMPPKRQSLLILGVYVLLGVPTFLLGNRASLVLRVAFVVAYFFIRDYTESNAEGRWITRSIRIGFIVFVLFAVAFLGAFNYYRVGIDPNSATNIPILLDFFYRQGTTFDTVCQGLQYKSMIMNLPQTTGYSIGPIYDTVKHSTLFQLLFDTVGLDGGNSINMVMNSNSLSHKLSYIVLGENGYLSGHGRGSSYLIELYYDGGMFLVGLFSLVLGIYLASINRIIQKRMWFPNTMVIISLSKIFYIPRASTFDFLAFVFTPHFWLIIGLVMVALIFSDRRRGVIVWSRRCVEERL